MTWIPPKPKPLGGLKLLGELLSRDGRSMLNLLPAKAYQVLMGSGRVAGKQLFLVNDPQTVREVLVERASDFPKHTYMRDILQPLIGVSLINVTDIRVWEQQQRLVAPAFEQASLRRAFPAMVAAVDDLLARTDAYAGGQEWPADDAMSEVTADIIFRTIFSTQLSTDAAAQVYAAFRSYQDNAQRLGLFGTLRLPIFWYLARLRKQGAQIRAAFEVRIRERFAARDRGDVDHPQDMLTALMESRDESTGARLSMEDCIDQVGSLFLAGHETSASTLAWALYLIAKQPIWQDRIREQVLSLWGDRVPEFGDTKHLSVAHAVFRETLRLYPPIAVYLRESARQTELRGKSVCPHTMVTVSPWVVHRHEKLWNAPDAFDPGRFETEAGRESARCAYLPFNMGPRVCPGAAFATQESVLILAQLVRRYRIDAVDGHDPKPTARLTLRSANGVRLRLTKL